MKDVRHVDLESLVKYMYAGQVYIAQDQLGRFLKTAEALQVKGLAENPNISSKPEGAEEEEVEEEREEASVKLPGLLLLGLPLQGATLLTPCGFTTSLTEEAGTVRGEGDAAGERGGGA